jgi:hypothetical protein
MWQGAAASGANWPKERISLAGDCATSRMNFSFDLPRSIIDTS